MISVKAYGKILVFGAYSILEPGNIGLVVNVNKGTTATIEESKKFEIILHDFDIKTDFSYNEDKIVIKDRNERLNFIKSAIQYSLEYLRYRKIPIKKFRLTTFNDSELSIIGRKTGLGSSATSTVSSVAAIMKFHEIEDKNMIYKISRYAHYMAQGSGSGFDVAAAVYGSHFFVSEKEKIGNFTSYIENAKTPKIEKYTWPNSIFLLLVFSGRSASTKEFVKKVLEFKERNSNRYKVFMKKYNGVNLKLKSNFEKNDIENIKIHLEKSWKMRKKLGELAKADIEPVDFTETFFGMKKNGAFAAGLTGAGGGDSILTMFKNKADKENLIKYLGGQFIVFSNLGLDDKKLEIN